ncbi:LpxI family protein [Denitrobaculum tricleocarpae]|uniref:LpxI family protein n=1 Tax=Denitrobaculum tricleocarpae TaxID=2591009 RepID=A0A545TPI1_9PROT|nr:UDP-2,3-diacylglucosamine diphosphatase LpxI [Denitrobaculum tricleocarpae]TQV79130.1 LpxI family protein [Denitrobaculum tricleocarpae]
MGPKLGILAGSGELPVRLRDHCLMQGRDVFIIAFNGHTDPSIVEGVEHFWTRLGSAYSAIKVLRDAGVGELVMAGGIQRPTLKDLRPDFQTLKFMTKIGSVGLGDDGMLTAIINYLENEGFQVVGADDVLGDILARDGVYGRVEPDAEAWADIDRGIGVARALGAQDVGQSVIVQQGFILGVEAVEGTDALIKRCAELKHSGAGGVLVKVKKPQQERRADLPTIGPVTVRTAAESGLRGIAVEAGGALIVDRDAVQATADAAGIFVIGIEVPQ